MESLEKKSKEPNVLSAFTRELIVHMTSYGVRPSTNFYSEDYFYEMHLEVDMSVHLSFLFNDYYCHISDIQGKTSN